MSSSAKTAKAAKVDVYISKNTGGAYADVRQVIQSEIGRIREEYSKKTNGVITHRDSHNSRGDKK